MARLFWLGMVLLVGHGYYINKRMYNFCKRWLIDDGIKAFLQVF